MPSWLLQEQEEGNAARAEFRKLVGILGARGEARILRSSLAGAVGSEGTPSSKNRRTWETSAQYRPLSIHRFAQLAPAKRPLRIGPGVRHTETARTVELTSPPLPPWPALSTRLGPPHCRFAQARPGRTSRNRSGSRRLWKAFS